jgi:vancomycin resistance protein YoaR
MTKHVRLYLIGLLLLPLISGAAVWALYAYGSQQTLPTGFTISGWKVGGMPYAGFEQQFQEHLRRLARQHVMLSSPVSEVESKELALGELGAAFNEKELASIWKPLWDGSILARAKHRWKMKNGRFELTLSIEPARLASTVKQNWQGLYKKNPIPAKRLILNSDEIQYEAEQNVWRVQMDALRSRLESLVPSIGSLSDAAEPIFIELPLYEEPPSVTVHSLRDQGIDRKLTEYTTKFATSGEGRIYNIRSTAASIQDMLLKPGEIFDYAKVIQKTAAEFGYKEAPVIVNGKLVPGIGGGICQVSTTLYNAVLRSGLEVVERRNHSLPIRYVPLGQDATFADGYINFTFRNNTGKYLLIRTLTTDKQLTVKLFGDMPASITYDISSKIVKTLDPPIQFVHNPTLKRGSSQKLIEGKQGYIVETYRYKKENGLSIQKELISTDRYSPEPSVIATNNGSIKEDQQQHKKQPVKPIIEDGIAGPVFH